MQRLEISGAVRPIYGTLGVKRLIYWLGGASPLFIWLWEHFSVSSYPAIG